MVYQYGASDSGMERILTMNDDMMHSMQGNFLTPVDYPLSLSDKGKKYFLSGLFELRSNLEFQFCEKNIKLSDQEFSQEIGREINAVCVGAIYDDMDLGPVSILYNRMRYDLVRTAIRYSQFNNICHAHDLFVCLSQKVGNEKGDFGEARKEIGRSVISALYDMFHASQFDLLDEEEQEFYIHGIRYSQNIRTTNNYGFRASAVSSMTQREVNAYERKIMSTRVDEIFPSIAEYFIRLQNNFSSYSDNPCNAYNYVVAQRVIHAFEHLQALLPASMNVVSYGDFMDGHLDGHEGFPSSFQKYQDYHTRKLPDLRTGLLKSGACPPELQKNFLWYPDFTNTTRRDMIQNGGSEAFDGYLQKELDKVATEKKLAPVDVNEFRQVVTKYARPMLPKL